MKAKRPPLLAALLFLTASLLATISSARAEEPAPKVPDTLADALKLWLEPAEPVHLAGPIHFVGTKGLCVYLITTPAGHILLGGGMPPSAEQIEASIRKLGFKPEDVKILLCNHAHIDHVGTTAALQQRTGAAVAAMEADVELLASGGRADYLFSKNAGMHYSPVKVDRPQRDGATVELGGVKLKALHTPGHTRGCAVYTMTISEGGRTYEVVFADGTGINAGTRFVHDPSYPGILDDYRRTIRTLEGLKPDIFLAYHPGDFDFLAKRERLATQGVAALVDPAGYARFLTERKAKLESLVAKEEAAPAAK